ncbi:hypothetical protein FIBSPDRAFT_1046906 [Athelia psychrophila]|uniref:Uncharacterized protein n=1 Tax=Athelia psychrophila TaxID=1759441 RepID=A0A166G204_9AGAM|nr:hypothetical protein FIBSPDRAFT_1046906 [Fibularhizoctonia sp. CBS 109695]
MAPATSWAALLRPSTSSPWSKSQLPTSSVVGFSIPDAPSFSSSSAPSIWNTNTPGKPDVLALCTADALARAGQLGNTRFADSVLQILIYCTPFHACAAHIIFFLAIRYSNIEANKPGIPGEGGLPGQLACRVVMMRCASSPFNASASAPISSPFAPKPISAAPSKRDPADFVTERRGVYKPGSGRYDALLPGNYAALLPSAARAAFEGEKFT